MLQTQTLKASKRIFNAFRYQSEATPTKYSQLQYAVDSSSNKRRVPLRSPCSRKYIRKELFHQPFTPIIIEARRNNRVFTGFPAQRKYIGFGKTDLYWTNIRCFNMAPILTASREPGSTFGLWGFPVIRSIGLKQEHFFESGWQAISTVRAKKRALKGFQRLFNIFATSS